EELEQHATNLRDHRLARLFGESPIANLHLPDLPPNALHLLQRQASEPEPSTDNLVGQASGSEGASSNSTTDVIEQDFSEVMGVCEEAGVIPDTSSAESSEEESPLLHNDIQHTRNLDLVNVQVADKDEEAQLPAVCVACQDQFPQQESSHLACGHDYCHGCLVSLFNSAMTDESLYPPRCCRELIPLTLMQSHFSPQFVDAFYSRQVELSTPNRTYCSKPTCSAFIEASNIEGGEATCPICNTQTCVVCQSGTHEGDCAQDPAVVALMTTAAREGFKQYVVAVRNSATSAGSHGKTVHVSSSIKIDFSNEQNTLLTETVLERLMVERATQRFNEWRGQWNSITLAPTKRLSKFVEAIFDVKRAVR
ncbi:MAG: hypothetical protein Q9224_006067, partial [Gallowayella concinna]